MKPIYKKLMEQHGGSIPFEILGGVQEKISNKKKTVRRGKPKKPRKPKKREKTKRRTKPKLNPNKYSVGTIIRTTDNLVRLSPNKQWIKFD